MSLPRVPRCWPGETIVCVGSGPSLTQADVDFCRGRARVLAVNDAVRLAPWADVLYAPDAQWWHWHGAELAAFDGLKYGFQIEIRQPFPDVILLQRGGPDGIDDRPTHLRSGGHGGYQAVNLARHFGPATIVLLGYDMRAADDGRHHFFGEHPNKSHVHYDRRLRHYFDLPPLLATRGIRIVNASRETAIRGIDRVALAEILPDALPPAA